MKQMNFRPKRHQVALATLLVAYAAGMTAQAQDKLTEDPWKVDIYYENDTRYRGKDNTGKAVGLSKFRNTLQIEADKRLSGGWDFRTILRGSFDGVYRLNSDQYGYKAGSKSASDVQLENTISKGAGIVTTVDFGRGIGKTTHNDSLGGGELGGVDGALTALGVPPHLRSTFIDSYGPNNPGTGLRVLGDRWHGRDGGVQFAVPVRPCDADPRGCVDFGGYGDRTRSELEFPEFNKNLDFIREAYVKNTFKLSDGTDLFLKIGRQQIVWGRTDLFRVLDVFNPVDYSRNNIYDELQDIRIPLWSAQAEWRLGGSETMQERNLQVVWSFDRFRANNLGQCGTPNAILDAGCFFRGMKNLWDNGGTVANFAHFNTGVANFLGAPPDMFLATNFGPGQIGIRNVHLPKWGQSGTVGVKYEGVTKGGLSYSLNAMTYRSQLPSLRAFNRAENMFIGVNPYPTTHLIAFDMHFPRINMIGGSMDFQWEAAGAAVRVEGALTSGEEFANTARPELYSKNKVFRSVIGIDRPTFIPAINPNRTTLFSAQLFYQHIFDHEVHQGPLGTYGMPDWKNNFIGTLLMKSWLSGDRISPQIITAYDFKAKAGVISPSVEWLQSDNIKWTFGANVKFKNGSMDRWKFNDCRDCNPYAPFTAYDEHTGAGPLGLSGLEPLGRFRAGPIGTAWKENELFVTLRYKF
jgi:hypothetical protein